MDVSYQLQNTTLSSGDLVTFDEDSITLIIGPNNSGKSRLLYEIEKVVEQGIEQSKAHRKVIADIKMAIRGNESQFLAFVKKNSESYLDGFGNQRYRGLNFHADEMTILNRWTNLSGFHESKSLICTYATTLDRLTVSKPPNSINRLKEVPIHPVHLLYANECIENKISEYFQLAFGVDLVLNRGAGSIIPLYVGTKPIKEKNEDRVSSSYLERLEKLDLIEEQGDGIRSFAGCLLSILTNQRFITLIDEPEAFLHPPQARLMGAILAKEHNKNQLIISTHSSEFLMGILDQTPEKLNIIRLTRTDNKNYAVKLNPSDIKNFWSDPILRFSNILDGLFHEQVIICESDTDCRFYAAISDKIFENKSGNLVKKPDLFFTSSGGKGRIGTIAKSLLKIKMPTKVIVDFDILFELGQFKGLYESLGGLWSNIEDLYSEVITNITKVDTTSEIYEPINNITKILESAKVCGYLSEGDISKIKLQLKVPSFKTLAKRKGVTVLKKKSELTTYDMFKTKCEMVGLWIVSCGELESFDETISGHGVSWVAKVMEKDLLHAPELELAREFILSLVNYQ